MSNKHVSTSLKKQKAHRYLRVGRINDASTLFQRICKTDPFDIDSWLTLGILYGQQDEISSAKKCFEHILEINPLHLEAHLNLCVALINLGKTRDAISLLKNVLEIDPHNYSAHDYLANLYQDSGNHVEAIPFFEKLLEYDPNNTDVLINLGISYREISRFDDAEKCFREALKVNPDSPIASYDLCAVLKDLGELDKALPFCQKAVASMPTYIDAILTIGNIYREKGEYDHAVEYYQHALKIDPSSSDAYWNMSVALLLTGNYSDGWKSYDNRMLKHPEIYEQFSIYPRWDGDTLTGKTILVYGEQGLGDEIMFASCFPEIINRSKKTIVICEPRLIRLFSHSFPQAAFYSSSEPHNSIQNMFPSIDYQIACGSLGQYFRNSLHDFPKHSGYIHPDPIRKDFWQQRLNTFGAGIKIGISWRGGTTDTRAYLRSIPLKQWMPILKSNSAHFFSLQYTDCQQELIEISNEYDVKIHHWQEAIDDYNETAALVSALDLVISVQTSIIHLSGALGKKVWVLVSSCPEWRYLAEGNSMPWYPSAELFRQEKSGVWEDVIIKVNHKLADLMLNHKSK